MKWYKNVKLRSLKKFDRIFHSGSWYTIPAWKKVLEDVMKLKVGDPIYNPYIAKTTTITSIEFEWGNVRHRSKGKMIYEFTIKDDQGYLIYDDPEYLNSCYQLKN